MMLAKDLTEEFFQIKKNNNLYIFIDSTSYCVFPRQLVFLKPTILSFYNMSLVHIILY